MTSSPDNAQSPESPRLTVLSPALNTTSSPEQSISHNAGIGSNPSRIHRRLRAISLSARQASLTDHVHVNEPRGRPKSSSSSVYKGSFSHTPRRSIVSLGGSNRSPAGSHRSSLHAAQLKNLLIDTNLDLETYDLEELRDGFFDAAFFKPPKRRPRELLRDAEETLPRRLQKKHPLSASYFFPSQWHGFRRVVEELTTTRAGLKLTKSFLAFFIAYVLCLVPAISSWLGRYNYVLVLSTILNHPGRTVGAQIDGAVATITGTVAGLVLSAFALWVSDFTSPARRAYGGILATFLILFMVPLSALRAYHIRTYQFVLCAGIAIIYTCLADTSDEVAWDKFFAYGIPWGLGQAICLLVCCVISPDAGARPLAVALHDALGIMVRSLALPQDDGVSMHRQLAVAFVTLSQAYQDLAIDITFTRIMPSDVMELRNLMQAVIRSLLSLKMDAHCFNDCEESTLPIITHSTQRSSVGYGRHSIEVPDIQINIVNDVEPTQNRKRNLARTNTQAHAIQLVVEKLSDPTLDCLECIEITLQRCDAVLMSMSGYRKYLGPPEDVSSNILDALIKMRKAMMKYDAEEGKLLQHPDLPSTYSDHPEVVKMLLFSHPIRHAATCTENFLIKVMSMQQDQRGWRLNLPSYPAAKALQRTNAQVRHDRGGVTAGHFFQTKAELAKTLVDMSNAYKPLPHQVDDPSIIVPLQSRDTMGKYAEEEKLRNPNSKTSGRKRFGYKLWRILHRMQGFETRFGLKVAIAISLLSVPAHLEESKEWWNTYEVWWAVVMVWVMLHPRVGGNIQDLFTRALCAILGALWGGIAYGARDGDPYVMAVFAVIFMLPMVYRFTQSSHPRSGLVGCISFVVVSLGIKTAGGLPSVVKLAWTRGLSLVVGVVSAVIINWILWPFVARHELRKALSSMMIYCSIVYRGVVAKYLYFEEGHQPDAKDIEKSEILEARLREGFVRIRQLMSLTLHEPRLRAPFNPLPYSGLVFSLERFFEYVIEIRQSSLLFRPYNLLYDAQRVELLTYRRDAVAAVLMNLYVLAGGLRTGRRIPRYLPDAKTARKRLLEKMAEVEGVDDDKIEGDASEEGEVGDSKDYAGDIDVKGKGKVEAEKAKKWSEIYSYSYCQSLTGCVHQLEQLQKYTKEVCGEQGFDLPYPNI